MFKRFGRLRRAGRFGVVVGGSASSGAVWRGLRHVQARASVAAAVIAGASVAIRGASVAVRGVGRCSRRSVLARAPSSRTRISCAHLFVVLNQSFQTKAMLMSWSTCGVRIWLSSEMATRPRSTLSSDDLYEVLKPFAKANDKRMLAYCEERLLSDVKVNKQKKQFWNTVTLLRPSGRRAKTYRLSLQLYKGP